MKDANLIAAGAASPARPPRIFVVEVTFSVPVQAASPEEAERLTEDDFASDEWREGGGQFNAEYRAWEMTKAGEWANCLPWGGDGETTIGRILDAPQAPKDLKPDPEPTP